MFQVNCPAEGSVEILVNGRLLLRHTPASPALFFGHGKETIRMFRGNFDITDRVEERMAPAFAGLKIESGVRTLRFVHPCLTEELLLVLRESDGLLHLDADCSFSACNRLWVRLYAEEGEHVTGGGEQFSALDSPSRRWSLPGCTLPTWKTMNTRSWIFGRAISMRSACGAAGCILFCLPAGAMPRYSKN